MLYEGKKNEILTRKHYAILFTVVTKRQWQHFENIRPSWPHNKVDSLKIHASLARIHF
jgi:hypothetical protein